MVADKIKRLLEYRSMAYDYFVRYPYAPFLSQVVVIRRCNLDCAYCSEYDTDSLPVPISRLRKTIVKLSELHSNAITFTGGEPTLHPELSDIIAFAAKKIKRVSMVSNGLKLTPRLINSLNRANLGRLQISIDGLEPNETTNKVLKHSKKALHALHEHADFKVHINAVLGSIPFEETLQIVKYTRNLGFETTVQWLHDSKGHFLNPHKINSEQISILLKESNQPSYHGGEIIRVGLENDEPWKCRAGSRYLYIDEFSSAHYCFPARNLWGKPIDDLTEEDMKQNFYNNKPCAKGCTLGCVRDSSKYDSFRKQ